MKKAKAICVAFGLMLGLVIAGNINTVSALENKNTNDTTNQETNVEKTENTPIIVPEGVDLKYDAENNVIILPGAENLDPNKTELTIVIQEE